MHTQQFLHVPCSIKICVNPPPKNRDERDSFRFPYTYIVLLPAYIQWPEECTSFEANNMQRRANEISAPTLISICIWDRNNTLSACRFWRNGCVFYIFYMDQSTDLKLRRNAKCALVDWGRQHICRPFRSGIFDFNIYIYISHYSFAFFYI